MSKIEWTNEAWNPTTGCTKVGEECRHCYAEPLAKRLQKMSKVMGYVDGFKFALAPHMLLKPLYYARPQSIFINSMSDLFYKDCPTEYIEKVCRVMEASPWHTYQVLTKRADRMAFLLGGKLRWAAALPNVHWGISVGNRKDGLPRIPRLQSVPTAHRFLSVEPLLEDLGNLNLTGIEWVIVGGESGLGARPMEESWVLSILQQCRRKGVKFFFKQWGGRHKKKTGRILKGQLYDEMPAPSSIPIPKLSVRRTILAGLT